jgi:DMSO reductase anchor subunit
VTASTALERLGHWLRRVSTWLLAISIFCLMTPARRVYGLELLVTSVLLFLAGAFIERKRPS